MGASLYFTLASVAALIGVAILLWALLGDRSRGRPRCPKCWYSMQGAASLRCPECGHEVKRDRQLYKARRRWKWARVGVLFLLGAGGCVAYLATESAVRTHGWRAAVPTTVLLITFEFSDAPWIAEGLDLHVDDGDVWDWQWRWLGRHALRRVEQERDFDRYSDYIDWLRVSVQVSPSESHQRRTADTFERLMRHENPRFESKAIIYSVNHDDIDGSIDRLMNRLEEGPGHWNERTVFAITNALSIIGIHDERAMHTLITLLDHEHPTVRSDAVFSLAMLGSYHGYYDHVYDSIEAMLDDPAGEVRARTVQWLAQMEQDEDESWHIIESALNSDDVHLRRGAFRCLASMRSPHEAAKPYVQDALEDNDPEMQYMGLLVASLWPPGEIDIASKSDIVLDGLQHEDIAIREAAGMHLSRIDNDASLKHLDMLVEIAIEAGRGSAEGYYIQRHLDELSGSHEEAADALAQLRSHDKPPAR